jgi:predicted TIM-barrel fold metal-dependent hydrolase
MKPNKIDVHHHIVPSAYVQAAARHGVHDGGDFPFPAWSAEAALELMDRRGIATAITSVSAPGVHFGDDAEARELARTVNEIQAELVRNDPTRFGGFASLPLPDVDGSLAEIQYALDTLRLDGVVLMTSIGDKYLGDPAFERVFAELNRRQEVLFLHPTVSPAIRAANLPIPAAVMEFTFETTRSVASLIFSGTLERYPDMKIILSHGGGTLPYIAGRLDVGELLPKLHAKAPQGAPAYLKRLYYDTAIASTPNALSSLRELVDPSHILYGSDYPFLPEQLIERFARGVETYRSFDAADRQVVERDGALALFPRLRG